MKKRSVLVLLICAVMIFSALPIMSSAAVDTNDGPLTLQGLFAGKFSAGAQIFDCQRGWVSEGVWRANNLTVPYGYTSYRAQFEADDLKDKYFMFKETGKTIDVYDNNISANKKCPVVGLYLYNNDGSPAYVAGKMNNDGTGLVVEGTVRIVADEGILFISSKDFGDLGYLISNTEGYSYGDFTFEEPLYLREHSVEYPTLEELKDYNASDVPLAEGEILLRFYANDGRENHLLQSKKAKANEDFIIGAELSPSREGHLFTGWNSREDGSGTTYLIGAVYHSNMGASFYAQWLKKRDAKAPVGLGSTNVPVHGGNGTITGTEDTMEYSADGGKTWTDCSPGFTTLPAGIYQIRYKETKDYTASPSIEVTIGQMEAPPTAPTLPEPTQLAEPVNLVWSSGIETRAATWSPVPGASGYKVQLYQDGKLQGKEVSIIGAKTSHDFTSVMKAAGEGVYMFSVTAVGDGVNFTDSNQSAVSDAYKYIIYAEEPVPPEKPEQPAPPERPEKPSAPGQPALPDPNHPANGERPDTGDFALPGFWTGLALLAASGLVTSSRLKKRKQRREGR